MPKKAPFAVFSGNTAGPAWPRSCSSPSTAGRSVAAQQGERGRAMPVFKDICRAAAAAVVAAAALAPVGSADAQTQGTIKIGVLHSLSGTMAISESTLKDTVLMMVDDLNKKRSEEHT